MKESRVYNVGDRVIYEDVRGVYGSIFPVDGAEALITGVHKNFDGHYTYIVDVPGYVQGWFCTLDNIRGVCSIYNSEEAISLLE